MENYVNEIVLLCVRKFNITEFDLSRIATSSDHIRVELRLSCVEALTH